MNTQSCGLTSGIYPDMEANRTSIPRREWTREKYFVLETEDSEKRRPIATQKNQEIMPHKGDIKHLWFFLHFQQQLFCKYLCVCI